MLPSVVTSVTGSIMSSSLGYVSAKHTDYAPILFEDAMKRIQEQGGVVGFRNGNGAVVM